MAEPKLPTLGKIPDPALLALLALAFLLTRWGHFVEYFGDAGYNLYTTWQISLGKVLFRDLVYFHGPLAPLLEGWLLRLLGVSILTLVLANFVLVWLAAWALHSLFTRYFGRATAWLAATYFFAGFAFAQSDSSQNYNMIFPYKPEVTFDTLFAFGAFWLLAREHARPRFRFLAVGFLWASTALLSVEAFAALSVGLSLTFALRWRGSAARDEALPLLAGMALPVVLAVGYFWRFFSLPEAVRQTFNAELIPLLTPATYRTNGYASLLGISSPGENLLSQSVCALALLFLVGLVALWSHRAPVRVRRLALVLPPLLLLGDLWLFPLRRSWWSVYALVLPLFTFLFFACVAWDLRQPALTEPERNRAGTWLGFLAFGFALLGRMIFYPVIWNYGFFLAAPAALSLAAFLTSYLPDKLSARGLDAKLFREFFAVTVAAVLLSHFVVTRHFSGAASYPIGEGGDRGFTMGGEANAEAGEVMALAKRWVELNVRERETILFLPDGDIVNYLTRRERSVPFNYSGLIFRVLGEKAMLSEIAAHPPDFVAFHTNAMGDVGLFGVDPAYGALTRQWVDAHYDPVQKFGASPFQREAMGYVFYKRRR